GPIDSPGVLDLRSACVFTSKLCVFGRLGKSPRSSRFRLGEYCVPGRALGRFWLVGSAHWPGLDWVLPAKSPELCPEARQECDRCYVPRDPAHCGCLYLDE